MCRGKCATSPVFIRVCIVHAYKAPVVVCKNANVPYVNIFTRRRRRSIYVVHTFAPVAVGASGACCKGAAAVCARVCWSSGIDTDSSHVCGMCDSDSMRFRVLHIIRGVVDDGSRFMLISACGMEFRRRRRLVQFSVKTTTLTISSRAGNISFTDLCESRIYPLVCLR